jgi:hypothetical protein
LNDSFVYKKHTSAEYLKYGKYYAKDWGNENEGDIFVNMGKKEGKPPCSSHSKAEEL